MLTAELLSETQPLIYVFHEHETRLLLDHVKTLGIKQKARATKISARHLYEAVNGKSRLQAATIAKLRDHLNRHSPDGMPEKTS